MKLTKEQDRWENGYSLDSTACSWYSDVMHEKPCEMRGMFGEGMRETHKVLYVAERLTHMHLPKVCHTAMIARGPFFVVDTKLTLTTVPACATL